jgi:hypothetical protein
VIGNGGYGFSESLLDPRLNTLQETLAPIDINYDGTSGYRMTQFTYDISARAYAEKARVLQATVDTYRTSMLGAQDDYRNASKDYAAEAKAFAQLSTARDRYHRAQDVYAEHTGQYIIGDAAGYRRQLQAEFQEAAEGIRLGVNRESGNWLDATINYGASTTLGYGDAWSLGYASEWSTQLHGNGFTGANQDSYFYAGGNIAGTATFGYVTGAAFARANAVLGGFTRYGALAAQTGLFGYGAITLGYQANDTYSSWDNLSGSQRMTAIGAPIAGLVGGYVGYKAVPAESLLSWSNAGAASRAQVNQFASAAWQEISSYRITLTPYNPNVLYANPIPISVSKVSPNGKSRLWSSTKAQSALENAYSHWVKHAPEFPEFLNAKQYVDGAHQFVKSPPSGTLTKTRPNGDNLFFDPATNTFASQAANGAPRTMFRPSGGINYWNKQ